ncbi:unnamed protein product [Adineta ricciae]|uniref:Uncharacterized protein n=2 Tax=Adineta ricciae TaxID=249248 RepID=A0A815M7T4_ADIRI|nr:unnamed protein product [Adineta ricciae]
MVSIAFFFLIITFLSLKGRTIALASSSCASQSNNVEFTLSTASHSASNPTSSCSLQQCITTSANNQTCSLSPTPCFNYRTTNNISYCAPAIDCPVLQPCNNVTYSCASNDSVCIVNSCCSPIAVCLPLLTTNFCPRGWSMTGSMNVARYAHTASTLLDGKVLVTGGYFSGRYLNSVEQYDPSTGVWIQTGNMNVARGLHTASTLLNGKVLVTGGIGNSGYLNSAELYDPSTGVWTQTGNMSFARGYHTASTLLDGKVLVTGGVGSSDYLNSAELYDPSTGVWTQTGNMSFARERHTASTLLDGKVLVTGGYNGTIVLNSTELY